MGNQNIKTQEGCEEVPSNANPKEMLIDASLYSEEMLETKSVDGVVCFMDSHWRINNDIYQCVFSNGGNRFISSLKRLKHAHKSTHIGDVFDGDGGLLPCKTVLFTVSCELPSPAGEDENLDFEWTLENLSPIVENQLQKASELQLETVAMPCHNEHPNPPIELLLPVLYHKLLTNQFTIRELHLITMDAILHQSVKDILQDLDETVRKQIMQRSQSMPLKQGTTENRGQGTNTGQETTDNIGQTTKDNFEQETCDNNGQETADNKDQGTSDSTNQHAAIGNNGQGSFDNEKQRNTDTSSENWEFRDAKVQSTFTDGKEYRHGYDPNQTVPSSSLKYQKVTDDDIDPALLKTFPELKAIDDKLTHNHPEANEKEEPLDYENDFEHQSDKAVSMATKETMCPVCLNEIKEDQCETLSKCLHKFCKRCIEEHFEKSVMKTCPVCREPYKMLEGNQPDGLMYYNIISNRHLTGYEGYGIIIIDYEIPDGVQGPNHPNPGVAYKGTRRTAYLPNSPKGNMVLQMLQKAFDRKLIFTVGTSATTGKENVVTWNDIHHKTRPSDGPERFGYPDPGYLDRVIGELKAKGITEI